MNRAAFLDLPPEAFPFTAEIIRSDTGAVVHTIRVDGPGAFHVPSFAHLGVRIDARITFSDGSSHTEKGPA